MLEIRKLTDHDSALAQVAWHWMREQPERYQACDGFDDFTKFWERPDEAKIAVIAEGEMIAYTWITFQGDSAEFGMVTPASVPLWTLARALRVIQERFQQDFPKRTLRLESSNLAALQLSRRLGWTILSERTAELQINRQDIITSCWEDNDPRPTGFKSHDDYQRQLAAKRKRKKARVAL